MKTNERKKAKIMFDAGKKLACLTEKSIIIMTGGIINMDLRYSIYEIV
jgi:hypothetical protein